MENWLYDEMQQVGTDYNNIQEVEDYDKRMSKFRNFDAEIKTVLNELNPGEEDIIVEFGSGTGVIALELALRCGKVIAVDISQKMLDYTAKKAKDRGISNIKYVNSGFLNYRHKDGPADCILTQLALHHLPDFWKFIALKRMNKILKPSGKLFLRDVIFPYDESIDYHELINTTLNEFSKEAGPATTKNFEYHIKSEYSTYDWILEEMFVKAGFKILKSERLGFLISLYLVQKI